MVKKRQYTKRQDKHTNGGISCHRLLPDVRGVISGNPVDMKPGFRVLTLSGDYRDTTLDEHTSQNLTGFEEAIRHHIIAHAAYGAALGHLDQPVYAQVKLQDESFAHEFWQHMALEPSAVDLRAFLQAHPQLPPPRWVYVPISIIRSGFFIASLIRRPWMRNALFVALYGYRNPIDCASCTETFLRTVDNNHEHIRFPFWACVSLKGFASGRCANCLWRQDKGVNPCSFRLHPERIPENALYEASPYLLAGSKASTWIIDPSTIPRAPDPLTPSTCPIDPMPVWHGEDRSPPPLSSPGLVSPDEHGGSDCEPISDDEVVDGPPSPSDDEVVDGPPSPSDDEFVDSPPSPMPPRKRRKVGRPRTRNIE